MYLTPHFRDDFTYNARFKYFVAPDGSRVLHELMVSDKRIFNPHHAEALQPKKRVQRIDDSLAAAAEGLITEYASNALEYALDHGKDNRLVNAERAARRAKNKVFDYVMAEFDFKYFITLTLSGEDFARDDVNTAIRKLTTWLKNRVQRVGLKYIIVPEFHKDGKSIHFHGFINDVLRLVDSGCVLPPGGGKPIKRDTARRKGFDLKGCRVVYNLVDWGYGYTTAIELYGERAAAAAYIAKYIVKQFDATGGECAFGGSRVMIGGRYYYHSNNLRGPVYRYDNIDFDSAGGTLFSNPGCQLKLQYFDGKGGVK